jgi:hypothetical protein
MIRSLTGNQGISVTNGNNNLPYITPNSNNPTQGMLRICGNDIQAFDSGSWISLPAGYTTVQLSDEVMSALKWALDKSKEEYRMEQLAKENVTVAAAVAQVKHAEEQLKLVLLLTDPI